MASFRALGARLLGPATRTHPASTKAFASAVDGAKLVRFRNADSEEDYFGVFVDADESVARIAKRGPDGRMALSEETRAVDVLLPP